MSKFTTCPRCKAEHFYTEDHECDDEDLASDDACAAGVKHSTQVAKDVGLFEPTTEELINAVSLARHHIDNKKVKLDCIHAASRLAHQQQVIDEAVKDFEEIKELCGFKPGAGAIACEALSKLKGAQK